MRLINKPWGWERIIFQIHKFRFKLLIIKKGHAISLQRHKQKRECWLILKGHPLITTAQQFEIYDPGEMFLIEPGLIHRAEAMHETCTIAEMCYGSDKDIERLEDKYGRKK